MSTKKTYLVRAMVTVPVIGRTYIEATSEEEAARLALKPGEDGTVWTSRMWNDASWTTSASGPCGVQWTEAEDLEVIDVEEETHGRIQGTNDPGRGQLAGKITKETYTEAGGG